MQIFVNDRLIGEVAGERATVGDLVEALGVHVDPGEILTAITLDDEVISAGDEARYTRRPAAGLRRLTLSTVTVPVFAARLRSNAREALLSIEGRLERVVDALGRGEMRAAHGELAVALDELRLMLVLDQQAMQLGAGETFTTQEEVAPVAEALLGAQRRADNAATRMLLSERLLPLLRGWDARAAAHGAAAGFVS